MRARWLIAQMVTSAKTSIVNYRLLFANQGKQTSIFRFRLQQTNGSLQFPFCVCRKQTQVGCPRNNQIFFFSSNRNKPKLNLFRLFFGLFHKTPQKNVRFVSVFSTGIETTKTNRTFSKQTEKISKNALY
jgi:hypothetical protein